MCPSCDFSKYSATNQVCRFRFGVYCSKTAFDRLRLNIELSWKKFVISPLSKWNYQYSFRVDTKSYSILAFYYIKCLLLEIWNYSLMLAGCAIEIATLQVKKNNITGKAVNNRATVCYQNWRSLALEDALYQVQWSIRGVRLKHTPCYNRRWFNDLRTVWRRTRNTRRGLTEVNNSKSRPRTKLQKTKYIT